MGTYVVTGAASGMGRATAAQLRAAGHAVIGVDVAPTGFGGDLQADLSTAGARQQLVEAILKLAPVLDGVVAAAGLAWPHPDPARLVAVNFFGATEILAGLRPALAVPPVSYALAVSSVAAVRTPMCPLGLVDALLAGDEAKSRQLAKEAGARPGYVASKLALARWVRRVAHTGEWAGNGIRLNAIAPGIVDTPMMTRNANEAGLSVDEMVTASCVPLGMAAQPEEMAALFVTLLSPVASTLVGQVIFADGGLEAAGRADDYPRPAPDPAEG